MEVLKWTFLAERQLTIPELRHALASVNSSPADRLDLDDLPFEKSLIDCCYGLVVVDKQTSSIRLVHKSLQDFLKIQHDKKKIFETGQNDIARTCITYMSFSDMTMDSYDTSTVASLIQCNPIRYRPDEVLRVSVHINKYPFLQYAIHFWGEHVRKGLNYQETTDLAVNLLLNRDDRYCISRNLHLLALDEFTQSTYSFFPPLNPCKSQHTDHLFLSSLGDFSGIHLAAHFGLDAMFTSFLDRFPSLDINQEICCETALSVAVHRGHEAVVRLLLEREDIHVHASDELRHLEFAIAHDHATILRLFLDNGADPNLRNSMGQPLLLWATQLRYHNAVRVLVEKGANLDLPNSSGQTPLWFAACSGYTDISLLLLEKGAKVDSQSNYGSSALLTAAYNSHTDTLLLLLEKGADINLRNPRSGETPLCAAAGMPMLIAPIRYKYRNEEVVRILLEKGANINTPNNNGETPLSTAAVLGKVKLVRLLLTNNANINSRDNKGKTPLALVQSLIGQFTKDVRVNKGSRVGGFLKVDYLKELVIVEALLKENGGVL
jgi:ankyrin repeat protein